MPKPYIEPLSSGRIRLRLLEESDLPMTLAWRNQDHIRHWFLNSDVITPGQHQSWFRAYADKDDDFVFVIEEIELLRRPIGQLALYRIDRTAGRAEFGRLMIGDAEAAGKGLAREATARLVEEALGPWRLSEVYLEVRAENHRAIAIYNACGFHTVDDLNGKITMTHR